MELLLKVGAGTPKLKLLVPAALSVRIPAAFRPVAGMLTLFTTVPCVNVRLLLFAVKAGVGTFTTKLLMPTGVTAAIPVPLTLVCGGTGTVIELTAEP